ncbi:hypothetical protein U9R90_27890 [Streptomyces sp. E11-3]|uniref:hypothetical protein n=1 Tax=Streptomyces sp. E11-3 TaxID=3110112 RepID=UPI003980B064
MTSSTPGAGIPPERPAWLPDTAASRTASYRITPPEILARYPWRSGECFMCRSHRFVAAIGHRGDDQVPLTACGSCLLHREGQCRARKIRRGRPYVPGGAPSVTP